MNHILGQLRIRIVGFMKTKHLLNATDIRRLYTIQHTQESLYMRTSMHI